MDVSRTSGEGPRILKRFLEFAKYGRIDDSAATGRDADSPFEEDVADVVKSFGFLVDPQVGSAGFRIDMGIRHPDKPGTYLLALECDGATYHSALWARERDRLRQDVLEHLGWRFHRIWSTDWFYNRQAEIERLRQALLSAQNHAVDGVKIDGANKAPTDEARIAILEAGEAWEQATRAFATSEFLRQTVGPLEQQVALLGQSARAQALANLEAEREQIVLERGVEAWERYRAARIRLMEADFAQNGQEQFLQSLEDMVSATEAAAQNMADAFGSVGGAIGAITVEITRFASAQVAAAQRVAEAEREYGRTSFQYADARAAQTACRQ